MDSNSVGPIAATTSAPQTTARIPTSRHEVTPSSVDSAKRIEDPKDIKAATAAESQPQRDPRTLQFQVESGRVITTILDSNNKTVVLQIPDAEVIRIAKSIDRMQGFLLEQKA